MELGARWNDSNNTYSRDKADMRKYLEAIRNATRYYKMGLLVPHEYADRVDKQLDRLAEYYDNPF